ncbi:MAG: hypothetical protein WA125_08685 [Desulfosporosinus sp.]
MAFLSRTTLAPLLLTYDHESMYLHIDPQGCALFGKDSPEPFYRIQEPLLLAHGIMTDAQTVHLVVLKTSGELCYTLISGPATPQTTLIAKLDVRASRYQRLFLFPQGKIIHIFYAHTHQAIRDLWRIEHRYWDGSSWHSVHLGEVVHPRVPLYHVNLDRQGNLHLLTITFQGRHSLLYTNRFNGTFHIWGSPAETLKISGEVVDIAALMTSDNVHHLFWVVKAPNGQFEIRWAQQTDAHELASTWHPSPAPIKTFSPPWKSIGALEINGVLWLLAHTGEEVLMQNDGNGWKLISSHTSFHHPFKWVHKGRQNCHQTYWLEDQAERRAPVFFRNLGFPIKKNSPPGPTPFQTTLPILTHAIPPVPAFYPDQISPDLPPSTSGAPSPIEVDEAPEVLDVEAPDTPESPSGDVFPSLPLKESVELERLVTTVAHLEQENTNLSVVIQTMLAKFDQILGAISENVSQAKQPKKSKPKKSSYLEESADPQTVFNPSFEEHDPVKETISNLEKETESISQVLRVMLTKQEQSDSSLENPGIQISQLQEENKGIKNKGGFWNKWITWI